MTLPVILLALLIALLIGSIYHLIRGGGFWRWLYFLGLSIAGFAAGHFIGLWGGWLVFPIGSLNIGLSAAGSVLFLLAGDWLSRIESDGESTV